MVVILVIVLVTLYLLYYLCTSKFNYWKNKKVPYEKPLPLFGNFKNYILLRQPISEVYDRLCKKYVNEPYFGVFYGTEPALVVQDPDLLKCIYTKDFYYFNSRENAAWMHKDPFGKTISGSWGDYWKVLRQNFTPMFTSAKMKKMFHLIAKCSKSFEQVLDNESKIGSCINGQQLISRFTMNGIATCAFGIESNTLEDDSDNNPFVRSGHLIFLTTKFQAFLTVVRSIWPSFFYPFGFTVVPETVMKFFRKLVQDIIEQRGHKPSNRHDFVDLMLDYGTEKKIEGNCLNNSMAPNSETKRHSIQLNNELISLMCMEIFAAGFETTATTLNRVLYELAKDQNAQTRAQEEVDAHLREHDNKLEYDNLSKLEFLNACVDETLRLHPTLTIVTRELMDDFVLPTGLKLEKGLRIHLPTHSIQHNPVFYSHPDKFLPERFMPGQKEKIIPYTYSPFGEGQRKCIGMRFAKMKVLAGLVTVLKKYEVEADWVPNRDFNFLLNIVVPRNGIKLRLKQRVDDQTNNFNL